MGNYLERSMQIFMDQQAQFRQQMGNLLGQTPWTMMNQLTERNLEIWQEFQRNMTAGMGRPTARPTPTSSTAKDAPQREPNKSRRS
jgi:polyhydroxyalkanoate synthesis regulator protein